jgi:hypothetical protein
MDDSVGLNASTVKSIVGQRAWMVVGQLGEGKAGMEGHFSSGKGSKLVVIELIRQS